MKPRITVITLGVSDLEKSLLFYRDGLGWLNTYIGDTEGKIAILLEARDGLT